MKKLLLPLIILLLIIGYFMSRDDRDASRDAIDSMESPSSESMPGDGTGSPGDTAVPQESDVPDVIQPGDSDTAPKEKSLEQEAKDVIDRAADKTGDAIKDAGDATKRAADDVAEELKKAGEKTEDAAEEVIDKIRGHEDKSDTESQEN
ncbi:hypothetical protein Maes01_01076 [Microbulbifer aestuariivivens]|uniref:YtxH domain-containing protein n=1 Tax=Microbulbifer aestuariivivens TaxID=1908308 RepID=A0ABP9WN29_9GAMM